MEDRTVPAVFNVGARDVATLIADINTANSNDQSNVINLTASTYDLKTVNNLWYGPNGLPAIRSNLTLHGNGATIQRDPASSTPNFRLFYVSGGLELSPGSLSMDNVVLQGGVAKGGDSNQGGGGLGAGTRRFTMRSLSAALIVVLSLAALVADEKSRLLRWTKDDLGKLPAGWKAEQTGKGRGSVWKIVADRSAPSRSGLVLAQTAEGPAQLFNLCVADEGRYQDVEVQVAFKAVCGKEDQGGGLVWRYQDANNYYVARMNPLESNYRLYKVVAGKRTQLATKEDSKIPTGEWHVLKIKQAGEHIECWLDGSKHLEITDKTFSKAGRIGLWTKADAQTYFHDLRVTVANH